MTVKAQLVESLFGDDVPPGAFKFYAVRGDIAGLNFLCPCGCGDVFGCSFKKDGQRGWVWDGNKDAPTLYPSVKPLNADGSEHWHGWLKGGEWSSC